MSLHFWCDLSSSTIECGPPLHQTVPLSANKWKEYFNMIHLLLFDKYIFTLFTTQLAWPVFVFPNLTFFISVRQIFSLCYKSIFSADGCYSDVWRNRCHTPYLCKVTDAVASHTGENIFTWNGRLNAPTDIRKYSVCVWGCVWECVGGKGGTFRVLSITHECE